MIEEESLIIVNNLTLSHSDHIVINNASFKINNSKFYCILGVNGGGKTTLLKALVGEGKIKSGTIDYEVFQGRKVSEYLGYVPQRWNVSNSLKLTAFELVLLGSIKRNGWFRRYNSNEKELAIWLLSQVGLISMADKMIQDLSVGQLQRLLIAKELMAKPSVLFLDEATAGVDLTNKEDILFFIRKEFPLMAVLLATHDIHHLHVPVDMVITINQGKITEYDGTKTDISNLYDNICSTCRHEF